MEGRVNTDGEWLLQVSEGAVFEAISVINIQKEERKEMRHKDYYCG